MATYLLSSTDYDVYFVNPNATEILGRPVYKRLADLPVVPDLVDVFRRREDGGNVVAGMSGLERQIRVVVVEVANADAVGERGLVHVLLVVEGHGDLVDDPIRSAFANLGFDLLCLDFHVLLHSIHFVGGFGYLSHDGGSSVLLTLNFDVCGRHILPHFHEGAAVLVGEKRGDENHDGAEDEENFGHWGGKKKLPEKSVKWGHLS